MFGTRKSTQLIRFLQIFFRIFKKKYKPPKTGPEMSIKTTRNRGAGTAAAAFWFCARASARAARFTGFFLLENAFRRESCKTWGIICGNRGFLLPLHSSVPRPRSPPGIARVAEIRLTLLFHWFSRISESTAYDKRRAPRIYTGRGKRDDRAGLPGAAPGLS